MNSLNSVLLEGNLTRDPDLKYTSSGTAVCKISIAVNRSWKKGDNWEQEVSYFDITVWGKRGETCNEYLQKGRGVRVVGRLKQDRWQDADNGKARSKVHVIADQVEFKPKSEKNNKESKKTQPQQSTIDDDFEDDVPF